MRVTTGFALCGLCLQTGEPQEQPGEAEGRTVLARPVQDLAGTAGVAAGFFSVPRRQLYGRLGIPPAQNAPLPRTQPDQCAPEVHAVPDLFGCLLRFAAPADWPGRGC